MAFEKNIRGLRIDGDISVSTVSGTTFSAGTSINVGGIAGFYADSTKAIIGGLPVAGFNGAVGVFNARSSMAGINRMFVGESASLNTSAALTSNEWTMVTITGDISAINFYRNSVLISTNPPFTLPSSGDSTGDLSLSSLVDTGSSAKPHYKDCVGIWNRALSLSEIGILYNSGSGYELK